MDNYLKIIREDFAAEPPVWALWLVLCRFARRLKGVFFAWIFGAPGLQLGRGSTIRGVKYISLGSGVRAKSGLWLEAVTRYNDQAFKPSLRIEDDVWFSDHVHISCINRVVVGRNTLMGSHIYISDHGHGIYKGPQASNPTEPPVYRKLGGGGPVVIGENVWVGDNVIITGPASIGDGVVIGANAVVRGDVPRWTIVAGVPAKPLKRFAPETGSWERV